MGVSQIDRIRNEEVCKRAGIESGSESIEMVEHLKRMDENQMTRRMFRQQ